uniref:MATH domain-containing protein n=1 Tax=Kwoniella dejecticola CBS 10117 TaxID=1296121 RepID=A0A1A6ACW3_9TREE|nr:uncharacterized protein I303_02110 [Kwoniella dejecticola CBS 10117]OBR87896.1 hypothetical protein I303_02110 [Kwoniella dejecticola CBS 10117]
MSAHHSPLLPSQQPPPPSYTLAQQHQHQSPTPNPVQAVPPTSSTSTANTTSTQGHEFSETTSICLEWRLSGLKAMYESTRGDQKSKCIKSAVFGDADNLWEVLWYPNAGTSTQTTGDHVSLYLSCVPTAQERESSIQNKWTRKGLWWFKFEVRPITPASSSEPSRPGSSSSRTISAGDALASKDASDHTFAVKTANWGWQAFAKRDVLFQNPQVLHTDSFMIICTIQAQPQPPAAGGTSAAGGVKRVVPKELVSSVGSMLDDPLYSDVEFIIPSRKGASGPRRIYANKKLLRRYGYFQAMFHGGFKEVEDDYEDDSDDDISMLSDSDIDDESMESPDSYNDEPLAAASNKRLSADQELHLTTTTSRNSSDVRRNSVEVERSTIREDRSETDTSTTSSEVHSTGGNQQEPKGNTSVEVGDITLGSEGGGNAVQSSTLPQSQSQSKSASGRLQHGRTPSSVSAPTATSKSEHSSKVGKVLPGPKKTRVVIRDAAWSTWWAVLYWIYTDIIYFAPLNSSFEHQLPSRRQSSATTPISGGTGPASGAGADAEMPRSRKEWIHRWMIEHEMETRVGPRPVSAKAIYRLADKLDLPALKLRAFQHILGGLTAGNVPAEVFSKFSSTYEDVRKVQVAFFLRHWGEIKKSETMSGIWTQIRNGKHVGFEEVWPLIVGQLDFRPST